MNLTSLRSTDFKQIVKLLAQKEALLARLAKINSDLAGYESGPVTTRVTPKAKEPKNRPKLKARIIRILQAAGKDGITVKDLAGRLGIKARRLYNWFYSTGKRIKQIKHIGKAKYRWGE
jgi:AraC-like DNA-binding protein